MGLADKTATAARHAMPLQHLVRVALCTHTRNMSLARFERRVPIMPRPARNSSSTSSPELLKGLGLISSVYCSCGMEKDRVSTAELNFERQASYLTFSFAKTRQASGSTLARASALQVHSNVSRCLSLSLTVADMLLPRKQVAPRCYLTSST